MRILVDKLPKDSSECLLPFRLDRMMITHNNSTGTVKDITLGCVKCDSNCAECKYIMTMDEYIKQDIEKILTENITNDLMNQEV